MHVPEGGARSSRWFFFALTDPKGSKAALLSQVAEELESSGDTTSLHVFPLTVRGAALLAYAMLRRPSGPRRLAWYRFNWSIAPFIAASAIRVRLRGGKTVLSVPTPIAVASSELGSSASVIRKLLKRLLIRPMFIVAATCVDLVVEHGVPVAQQGHIFSAKTVVLHNPGTQPVLVTTPSPSTFGPPREIRFVGVSSNGHYHGYERLIHGMIERERATPGYPLLRLDLAGPLGAFTKERELVTQHQDIRLSVHFRDWVGPAGLWELLRSADIAVGPLGAGLRRGLKSGSSLRHRHYMAAGIPFFSDLPDLALENSSPAWAKVIDSSDAPVDVPQILEWFHALDLCQSKTEMDLVLERSSISAYVRNVKLALSSEHHSRGPRQ